MRKCVAVLAFLLLAAFIAPAPSECASSRNARKSVELVEQATELMNKERYDKALPLLEKALKLDPDNTMALRYLNIYHHQIIEPLCKSAAEAYFSGDFPGAVSHWEEILAQSKSEGRVRALIEEALTRAKEQALKDRYEAVENLMGQERYAQAASELEQIIEDYPDEVRARNRLSEISTSLSTSVIREHYSRAEQLSDREDYDGAIRELESILTLQPDQGLATRLIVKARRDKHADIYAQTDKDIREGRYAKARATLTEITRINPTDAAATAEARRLEEVLRISPELTGKSRLEKALRAGLYNYLSPDGDAKAAVAASWYAVQLDPESDLALAVLDMVERDNRAVIPRMDPPVKEMNIIEQYLFASLNHIYEGRYDLALEECGIVLAIEPGNLLALKRQGSAYYLMGQHGRAAQSWERARKLSPKDTELKEFLDLVR